MNMRFVLMIIAALIFASLAAVIANTWIKSKTVVKKDNTHPVVVAASDIPFGVKLEDIHIKTINWPSANIPEGSFQKKEDVLGKIVKNIFYSGEVITKKRISEHLGGSTLSSLITERSRAITVRVNDVIGVAGFVLPGNRIDILASRRIGKRAKTRTILENIKVLAVDQEASPDKEKPAVVRAVTMELTPEQAERVVEAMQEGKIQLTLRNPLDSNAMAKRKVNPPAPVRRVYRPRIIRVDPW